MRILYIHQHFSTPDGSAGTRSYEMAQRLIAAGHQVTMLCGSYDVGRTGLDGPYRRGRREGQVDGIDVIELHTPYGNKLGFARRVMAFVSFMRRAVWIVLREKYDVLFATSTPLTVSIPAWVGKRLRRKPMVFEVRDLWPELPVAIGIVRNPLIIWAMKVMERMAYKAADRIVVLSPGMYEGVRAVAGPEKPVATVPNGCDLGLFYPDPDDASRPQGLDGRFVAMFTGAHGMANGLGALLDTAAVLQKRGRDDIRIVLVGTGGEKEALSARAEAERLKNVLFHDPVPKRELVRLLRGADAGLMVLKNLPAFYRGTSPNKFFDYIASGLPVINNYPGWLAGMIGENGLGIAVPPDDPEAFADALIRLAEDREAAAEMGRASRRFAEENFSRDLLARKFVEEIEAAKPTG